MCWQFYFAILTVLLQATLALICSRYPSNTFTPKSPVDENFVIYITGNPKTYVLGQQYNISLNAFNGLRFISFGLSLENENGDSTYADDLGHFEIVDSIETRYSPNCINMVENTNTNSKTRIEVGWIAPSEPGSGCILIRAMVLQHRDVWYMDDGGLTRRICEEVVDDVESQKKWKPQAPCCACDEARYELTFESVWSRNLHPKDFPTKGWITRFSDIVGAAHSWNYRFWQYGALASEGLREFGEHGSSRLLEREFNMNFKNGQIRTIIKARGPAFPNLNGKSIASVRVDPAHHMLSLASKIEPSPDWIVGVSGLELCMLNCTWLERKIVNLYPWDIGTDAGPTYTSADQPQVPPDVIRRMRSDFPNDPRSPFFDETGAPMKPLATLTIRRQRLYERLCEDEESNNIDVPRECYTHPWTHWTECTASCGEGHQTRIRVYKQPEVAKIYNCDALTTMRQDRSCIGNQCVDTEKQFINIEDGQELQGFMNVNFDQYGSSIAERPTQNACQLSEWSSWSLCNQTCGEGRMMRKRNYINPAEKNNCQAVRYTNLIQYKKCIGRNCLNSRQQERRLDDMNPSQYREFDVLNIDNTVDQFNVNNLNEPEYNFNPSVMDIERDRLLDSRQESIQNSELNNRYKNTNPEFDDNFEVNNQQSDLFSNPHIKTSNTYESARYGKQNTIHEGYNTHKQEQLASFSEKTSLQVPAYCFQPLQMFTCLDARVTGNFWFYNFCTDECMLFAADSCDKNDNKFTSLEMCEIRCRQGVHEQYLRHRQQQDCKPSSLASKRRHKPNSRNKHQIRFNLNN